MRDGPSKRASSVTPFLVMELLADTSVSVTPAVDFGPASRTYVRLSYTTDRDRIAEGMDRLESYLSRRATEE